MIGERGVTLSGGQRQRLAIARVFLKDPAVVILDEATSAVDTITERLIQESVEQMLKRRTAFIIAHRLSTVKKCDRIVVLEKGRIIQSGTHSQLMRQKGLYSSLHAHNRFRG
jgi:subfamily B ATP-binding cassette protein MsbA